MNDHYQHMNFHKTIVVDPSLDVEVWINRPKTLWAHLKFWLFGTPEPVYVRYSELLKKHMDEYHVLIGKECCGRVFE